MAWIIIEGVDRSGKSTVAKLFEAQGYKVVHFSAPDKKYSTPGYTGPSYLDDVTEKMISLSGQDVIFDRSWYGEKIWPLIYGRKPMLNDEDFEILSEIEEQNSVSRILMHDPDEFAHWQRCVENKEPINSSQFKQARQLYYSLADKYSFQLRTKDDFNVEQQTPIKQEVKQISQSTPSTKDAPSLDLTPEQLKLAQANAINEILSSRIVKKKGNSFDLIENKIRTFLNSELGVLLGTSQSSPSQVQNGMPFSKEEVVFLKALINRAKEKRT